MHQQNAWILSLFFNPSDISSFPTIQLSRALFYTLFNTVALQVQWIICYKGGSRIPRLTQIPPLLSFLSVAGHFRHTCKRYGIPYQ
jgi:ABC-type arginine/histidine transport system permease subunit